VVKMEKLKKLVEKAIEEILEDYGKDEKKYTTEGDLVSYMFAKLLDMPIQNQNTDPSQPYLAPYSNIYSPY